jgi:hypothetical protein
MNADLRTWLVRWLYGVAAVHFLVGFVLPWISDLPLLDGYHRQLESAFWGSTAPQAARAQQIWWIALFGPTIQGLSLWMGALVRLGEYHRSSLAWGALILGLVIWAPQDIAISLQAAAWSHVWADCAALAVMLPPLAWLWQHDSRRTPAASDTEAA